MSFKEPMELKKLKHPYLQGDYNWEKKKERLTTDTWNNLDASQGHHV